MLSSRFGTPEELTSDLVWLVNNTKHTIPERLGEVTELCPAIVYLESDEEPQKLFLGNPSDIIKAFAHINIAETEAPVNYRRISAVTILSETGIHLAVDSDRVNLIGSLERVQGDLGSEFDEIFTGGFTEYPDCPPPAKTLDTVGLIRQASMYMRLASNNRFNRDQTQLAVSIAVSQLANGMPMADSEVVEMVRMSGE